MDAVTIILFLSIAAGFLLAFSMGANDVSNAMAPAVGARAISIRQAVVIAAVLNCVGAIFLGASVTSTIAKGIIDPSLVDPKHLMLGMFAALLSSGIFVLIATITALPVSTTHALVGGIIGLGLILAGPDALQWGKIIAIVACWALSPFIGAILAFVVFVHIRKTILFSHDILKGAKRWVPRWIALTFILLLLSFFMKTSVGKGLHLSPMTIIIISVVTFIIFSIVGMHYISKTSRPDVRPARQVEGMFKKMQVFTACFLSITHGANDVSNAIGPVVAVYMIAQTNGLDQHMDVPLWLLIMGGVGIAFGTMLMGQKVMATVGNKITKLNNSRGFAVSFSAATTVLMATNLGMPVSTTHATVGSIVGVGLARGFAAVDFRVLGKILACWVLTVPISGFCCMMIYLFLCWIFGM